MSSDCDPGDWSAPIGHPLGLSLREGIRSCLQDAVAKPRDPVASCVCHISNQSRLSSNALTSFHALLVVESEIQSVIHSAVPRTAQQVGEHRYVFKSLAGALT